MSIADICITALLVLFAALGIWKGVQKTSLALGAFLISFVIAFFLSNVVAEALLGIDGVKAFVLGNSDKGFSLFNWVRNSKGDAPSAFLIEFFYNPIAKTIPTKLLSASFTAVDAQAVSVAFSMFSAIVGVGLFIVIRALMCIVTMIIKSYIPRKKSIGNRIAGFSVGAVRGGVWALAITLVFSVFGGLPAMSKAEKEFEQSGLAKYVNTAAYTIKNAMFIPDKEMLARLIDKGEFVTDKKPETPPEDEKPDAITIERYKLGVEFKNINYPSGNRYSVDNTTGEITENNGVNLVNSSDYEKTGFKQTLDAIVVYNNSLGASVLDNDGVFKDVDQETLDTYDGYRLNIYNIMVGADGIYTVLGNYNNMINAESFGTHQDAQIVEENNRALKGYYDTIVAKLETLETEYAKLTLLTPNDVVGPFGLPETPELVQDSVYVPPEVDPVVLQRHTLSAAFGNLNCASGEKYTVDTEGNVKTEADGYTEVSAAVYESAGFAQTVEAIVAYNDSLRALVYADDGLLKDADDVTLTTYEQILASIRAAMFETDRLYDSLDKYSAAINGADFGNRTDAEQVESANAELQGYYDAIVAALETLETEYAKLELLTVSTADGGAGALVLPENPAVVQDEVKTNTEEPTPEPVVPEPEPVDPDEPTE